MNSEPTPVKPLSYFSEAGDSWLPFIRLSAAMAIAMGAVELVYGLGQMTVFVSLLWPGALPLRGGLRAWPNSVGLVCELLGLVSGAILLVGGIDCLALKLRGRRLVILCTSAFIGLGAIRILVSLAMLLLGANRPMLSQFGLVGAAVYIIANCVSLLRNVLLPVFLLLIFTRPQVRRLFQAVGNP